MVDTERPYWRASALKLRPAITPREISSRSAAVKNAALRTGSTGENPPRAWTTSKILLGLFPNAQLICVCVSARRQRRYKSRTSAGDSRRRAFKDIRILRVRPTL